jgi:hypothetical protein
MINMKYSIFISHSYILRYTSNQKIRKKLGKIYKNKPRFPSGYVVIINAY